MKDINSTFIVSIKPNPQSHQCLEQRRNELLNFVTSPPGNRFVFVGVKCTVEYLKNILHFFSGRKKCEH